MLLGNTEPCEELPVMDLNKWPSVTCHVYILVDKTE